MGDRDPRIDPETGDVVQSAYFSGAGQVGRRLVVSAGDGRVRYITGTGRETVTRDCLPITWRKWCREHRAKVVTNRSRDY